MSFLYRVILQLSSKNDFTLLASTFFNESVANIEEAIQSITTTTVTALKFQCFHNKRIDEIFRIGKECSTLQFANIFNSDLAIVEKGRGINSEIFGVNLVHAVDEIAAKSKAKTKTVSFLMTAITPAILSVLHQIGAEKNYTKQELCKHLQKLDLTNETEPLLT